MTYAELRQNPPMLTFWKALLNHQPLPGYRLEGYKMNPTPAPGFGADTYAYIPEADHITQISKMTFRLTRITVERTNGYPMARGRHHDPVWVPQPRVVVKVKFNNVRSGSLKTLVMELGGDTKTYIRYNADLMRFLLGKPQPVINQPGTTDDGVYEPYQDGETLDLNDPRPRHARDVVGKNLLTDPFWQSVLHG